jgi:deoxyribodipyrimidine photo-lyase
MPEKKFSLSAHIFTRDLRLDDNPALLSALESSESVITCFAVEESLVFGNPVMCESRLAFLSESLGDLSERIGKKGGKLNFYTGGTAKLAEKLCKNGTEAVYMTRDYTPYAVRREKLIEKICGDAGCSFFRVPGSLLNEPEEVRKGDGGSYKVFTPFYRNVSLIPVPKPETCSFSNFSAGEVPWKESAADIFGKTAIETGKAGIVRGGRSEGLRLAGEIGRLKDYENERDVPAKNSTSMLSAYLRFGTISVREVYHKIRETLGPEHGLIRQLYWRDFFTHIAYLYPYVFRGPFQRRYEKLPWSGNKEFFKRWCEGMTGFPFIDAGMREMNETGYMHNRIRMAAASFLVKDLHIDWMRGERYFASKLTDYDPSVNNGNWQWAASTGCDAQPYFRIFNPWLQQKKYDPACVYIKRWIPELSDVEPEEIHKLYKRRSKPPEGYPEPLVDHKTEAQATKKIYSETVA